MAEPIEETRERLRRREAHHLRRRSRVATAVTVLSFPLLLVGGFVAGWYLGCDEPTIGGSAGAENDPCRGGGWVLLASPAISFFVWLVVAATASRWVASEGRRVGR